MKKNLFFCLMLFASSWVYGQYTLEIPQFVSTSSSSDTYSWVLGDMFNTIVTVVDLEEEPILEESFQIKVSNPVREEILVQTEHTEPLYYMLYNMKGQLLLNGRLDGSTSNRSIQVRHLPAQMYVLHVRNKEGLLAGNFKIVKQ